MSIRHMQRVAGPDIDGARMPRRAFASHGRYWAETFWVRPRRLADMAAHTDLEGEDIIVAHRDQGMVLAHPHLGNWETAGIEAARLGVDLVAAAESLPNPRISDWFITQQAMFGIDVVLVKAGASVELLRHLQNGRTLALPADRDYQLFGHFARGGT